MLAVSWCGLNLRNPIVVAAAGITGTSERMKRAEEAGAGAVVMKSLFEDTIPRKGDPSPHMKLITRGARGKRSVTLYTYEQASHMDEYQYAEEIYKAKRELSIPVIANLDCRTEEAWSNYSKLVEQAGADALEVKSCPHGEHLMSGEELAQAVRIVKRSVSIPVIAKLPGQLTNPYATALELEKAGADSVVMFNRFSGLEIDVESEAPVMHGGIAGHGGPWSIHYSLRWIAQTFPSIRIPIAGSGGVITAEDVVKYLLAGATVVEIATIVILEGYEIIGALLKGLEAWMERKAYRSLDEFRGKAALKLLGIGQVNRQQTVWAEIQRDMCTRCGICKKVCIYSAIDEDEGYFCTNRCVGCGLCAEICPTKCIKLVEQGLQQRL